MSKATKLENIDEKDLKTVLNGSSYATFCAKNDRELYREYKSGKTDELSELETRKKKKVLTKK